MNEDDWCVCLKYACVEDNKKCELKNKNKNLFVKVCIKVFINQQQKNLPIKTLFVESLSPPGRSSLEILTASPTVAFATLVASAVILEAC